MIAPDGLVVVFNVGQNSPFHIGIGKVGVVKGGAAQVRVVELGFVKHRFAEIRVLEHGVARIRLGKDGFLQVGAGEVGPVEVAMGENRLFKGSHVEICFAAATALHFRHDKAGFGQVAKIEAAAGELGVAQVKTGKVFTGEIEVRQVNKPVAGLLAVLVKGFDPIDDNEVEEFFFCELLLHRED